MIKKVLLVVIATSILFGGALDSFKQASENKVKKAAEKQRLYQEQLDSIKLNGNINSLFDLELHLKRDFKGELQVNTIIDLGGKKVNIFNKINGNGKGGFANGKIRFKNMDNVILDGIYLTGGEGGLNPNAVISNSKFLNRNYVNGGDMIIKNSEIEQFGPVNMAANDEHVIIFSSTVKVYVQSREYYTYAKDTVFGKIIAYGSYYSTLYLDECVIKNYKVHRFDHPYSGSPTLIALRSVFKSGSFYNLNGSVTLVNSIATMDKIDGIGYSFYSSNIWTKNINVGSFGLLNSILYAEIPGKMVLKKIKYSKIVSPSIAGWKNPRFKSEDYQNYTLSEKLEKDDIVTWGARFPNGKLLKYKWIDEEYINKKKNIDLLGKMRGEITNIGAVDFKK